MVTADTSVEQRQIRLTDPSRSLSRVERKMVRSTLSVSLREQRGGSDGVLDFGKDRLFRGSLLRSRISASQASVSFARALAQEVWVAAWDSG
jgi:hypothetical protein